MPTWETVLAETIAENNVTRYATHANLRKPDGRHVAAGIHDSKRRVCKHVLATFRRTDGGGCHRLRPCCRIWHCHGDAILHVQQCYCCRQYRPSWQSPRCLALLFRYAEPPDQPTAERSERSPYMPRCCVHAAVATPLASIATAWRLTPKPSPPALSIAGTLHAATLASNLAA